MPSFTKTLIAATAAIGLSAAAPHPAPWQDCAPGTSFFSCQITGYAGCCSVDACFHNGVCPDDQAPPPSTTSATTIPISTPTVKPSPPSTDCGDKRVKLFNPSFYTFHRDEPKRNWEVDDSFSISQEDHRVNKVNQAVVFGLPKGASQCGLSWWQKPNTTGFETYKTGGVNIYSLELGGLPWDQAVSLNGNNVTWEVVEKLMPEKKTTSADFTDWGTWATTSDDYGHSVGGVECPTDTPNLAFLMDLDGADPNVGMEGSVKMPQTKSTGWYLSYCPPGA